MRKALWILLPIAMLTLAGCAATATPALFPTATRRPAPTARPTVAPGADREAIIALIQSEGDLVVAQDIDGLMALWTEDATVTDAKNTPDNPADDAVWHGKDAIRNRYVVVVFPGAAKSNVHGDIELQINDDTAVAESTTNVGTTIAPKGDRWNVVKRNGVWYLQSLTYNVLPK